MHPVVAGLSQCYAQVVVLGSVPPRSRKFTVLPGDFDAFTHVLDIVASLHEGKKYWYAPLGKRVYVWGPFGG